MKSAKGWAHLLHLSIKAAHVTQGRSLVQKNTPTPERTVSSRDTPMIIAGQINGVLVIGVSKAYT
jgi:hypothetical protein